MATANLRAFSIGPSTEEMAISVCNGLCQLSMGQALESP